MTGQGHGGGRLAALLASIRRHTIWDEHAIPATEGYTQRILKRRILPLYDLVFIVAGARAWVGGGLPAMSLTYSEAFGHAAAAAITLGAAFALVGIAFPKLWALETVGKIALGATLLLYAISTIIAGTQGAGGRDFVGVAFFAFVLLPAWRLSQLGEESRARREARRKAAASREQAA